MVVQFYGDFYVLVVVWLSKKTYQFYVLVVRFYVISSMFQILRKKTIQVLRFKEDIYFLGSKHRSIASGSFSQVLSIEVDIYFT
jgi:transposase-like protein